MSEPIFFATEDEWRAWLAANHDKAREVFVGFHKRATGRPSLTYREALDGALAYGWIDGVRRSIDASSYQSRFTPRRKGSNWSAVNIARVEELERLGRMAGPGRAAFAARDPARTNVYSFEQARVALSPEQAAAFRADRRAWDFFQAQPPSYRKPAIWWVVSAKREETRARRLATLIADSAAGLRIAPMRRPASRQGKA